MSTLTEKKGGLSLLRDAQCRLLWGIKKSLKYYHILKSYSTFLDLSRYSRCSILYTFPAGSCLKIQSGWFYLSTYISVSVDKAGIFFLPSDTTVPKPHLLVYAPISENVKMRKINTNEELHFSHKQALQKLPGAQRNCMVVRQLKWSSPFHDSEKIMKHWKS